MPLRRLVISLLSAVLLLATVSGCEYLQGAQEVDTDPTEAKGPGLFTGREGTWTVIRGR